MATLETTGEAAPARAAPPPQAVSLADWIAVMAGILGAFMAVLDISVTNSSLPQIQGEIGATGTEGSWIGTGYLVAEIVMIPLSAWLVRVLGLRNFLLFAVCGFAMFSVGCGVSGSLTEMILCRLGQGFTGGAMIPTAMTIVTTRLPPAKQPIGFALFGVTAIMAPVFGPLVGGWLTDNANWHYIFFLNVPVAIGLIALLFAGLPRSPARWSDFLRADFVGIAGLVMALGGLTVVLEDGQKEQWFESTMICWTAAIAFVGAGLIAASQLTRPDPVIKLKLILGPGFGGAFFVSIVVGAALYSIPYVLPVFLGNIAGYNAEQTGQVVLISGIPSLLLLPVTPFLVRIMDLRIIAAVGLVFFALSCFVTTGMTVDTGSAQFVLPQILRGVGQALIMTPLSQSATAGVPREDAGDAAGLYNMARNLGGSLGLALTATLVDFRTAFHFQQISQSASSNVYSSQAYVAQVGMGQLSHTVAVQAMVMAYSDCFWVLGIALILVLPFVLLLRPLPRGASSSPAH